MQKRFFASFALLLLWVATANARDPLIGDWVIDLSKTTDDPPVTISFSKAGDGITFTNSMTPQTYTVKYDGSETPLEGLANTTVSLTRPTPRRRIMTVKVNGQPKDITEQEISSGKNEMITTRRPAGAPNSPGLVVAYRRITPLVPEDLLIGTWQIDYSKSDPPGGIFPMELSITEQEIKVTLHNRKSYLVALDGSPAQSPFPMLDTLKAHRFDLHNIQITGSRSGSETLKENWTGEHNRISVTSVQTENGQTQSETRIYRRKN